MSKFAPRPQVCEKVINGCTERAYIRDDDFFNSDLNALVLADTDFAEAAFADLLFYFDLYAWDDPNAELHELVDFC